ncbi:MAG: HlyC/CorC family transporter [Oscillospiraceae bacterium]
MSCMDGDSIAQIIILACLILCSAYFSATETAYSSMNRIRMKSLAEHNSRAALALKLADNYDKLLSTILVGNNLVNIAATSLATVLFVRHFGDLGPTLSTIVMTVAVLIFGEVSPKGLAKDSPERFAMFSAPLLRVLMVILTPVNAFFTLWKKMLNRLFKTPQAPGITEEELLTLVDEAENEGGINSNEGELLRSAIEFYDIDASDILIPRVDVEAVDMEDTRDEVRKVFCDSGFSRLPVYRDTIDNIVGILNQKDFYDPRNEDKPLEEILTNPLFVTPGIKTFQLFSLLQKNRAHMAIIVDEYGGTVGIVTLEDILEELVGEIWDEHDEVVEEIQQTGEGEYKVLCTADLEDLFELLGVDEEPEFPTVSGWVINHFGRIPDTGDSFAHGDLTVTVTKCDGPRVVEVKVTQKPREIKNVDGT